MKAALKFNYRSRWAAFKEFFGESRECKAGGDAEVEAFQIERDDVVDCKKPPLWRRTAEESGTLALPHLSELHCLPPSTLLKAILKPAELRLGKQL